MWRARVKRNLIFVISTTDIFAVSLIVPLYTQHLKSIGFSNVNIGFTNSLYSGVQFFASPVVGHLSDVHGSRRMLVASLLVCALGYPLMGLTASFAAVAAVRALIGAVKHTQLLCKNNVEEETEPPDGAASLGASDPSQNAARGDGHHFGKLSAFMSLGYVAGPAIGGYLIDAPNGFACMCAATGSVCAINAWFAYCLPARTAAPRAARPAADFAASFKAIPWSSCWDLFVLKLLTVFAVFSYYLNYNASVSTRYGVSAVVLGYSISLQGVTRALTGFASPLIYRWFPASAGTAARIRLVYLLMMGNLAALYWAPNFGAYLACLVPFNVCLSFVRIVNHEALVERTRAGGRKGIVLGAFNNVTAVSRAALPMVSGYLADRYGYDSGYVVSMVALMAAIAVISLPRRVHVKEE